MPKPAVLFYSPSSPPYASQLLQLCAVSGLKLRILETADLDRTVSALAQGLRPAEPLPAGDPLPEPVMILCQLGQGQLDRLLSSLRRQHITCLKAVLTPTNASWSLRALYDELCQERLRLS